MWKLLILLGKKAVTVNDARRNTAFQTRVVYCRNNGYGDSEGKGWQQRIRCEMRSVRRCAVTERCHQNSGDHTGNRRPLRARFAPPGLLHESAQSREDEI